ncbi:outer membrane protein assembly factor BamD [Candidatus Neoehrlichia procyonis]|uniref:Outer membrane protein assembly factor BamD n=1 Tax=Candidatus Neoehrlichia procyonis str. RAC413 TaxID=1359163 RepID=A0A0F3NN82_9RICK|nr:outer membrane protein assembly factor BamD [Candidatus Neoehrlichia lotoris]KJV69520.1 outer membrane assembly lipoYfiO family protein [Candidatus Neoehrlichia lotoris str. RAC413]
MNFLKVVLMLCCICFSSYVAANTKSFEEAASVLYNRGVQQFKAKKYENAIKTFAEIENLYPFSELAIKGNLIAAVANYQISDYASANALVDDYIQMYPNSENIDFAYYLRIISKYMQIQDIDLDQKVASEVLDLSSEFIKLFPDSEYVAVVKDKLTNVRHHVAGKEFSIGNFYLKRGEYVAALKRFNVILAQYNDTGYFPESVYRIYEIYLALGDEQTSHKYLLMLEKCCKGSIWNNLKTKK